MVADMRRVSVLIREDQYERLAALGINVSGLIRDLVDDHFSDHRVTISVTPETQRLYEKLVANTGATDESIEPFLRKALKELLAKTIEDLEELRQSID
jgi:hypothetical protein